MPHLNVSFSQQTPIVDLLVGVSAPRRIALEAAGLTSPPFEKARALIDTGASSTCVDPSVLQRLGVTATGAILIHTPSTSGKPHMCEQFDVSLRIEHPHTSLLVAAVPVLALDLASQGITALIGRDVLGTCLFIYDGVAASFTLAF